MDELQKCEKDTINNKKEAESIANVSNLGGFAAKEILKNIAEKPEVSKEANEIIWSNKTSTDLKVYNAGFEKGKHEGFSDGFTKGILTTAFLGFLWKIGSPLIEKFKNNKKK